MNVVIYVIIGPRREKTVFGVCKHQLAHLRRLISVYVVRFFESITSKLEGDQLVAPGLFGILVK